MNDLIDKENIDSNSVKNCWSKIKHAKGAVFFVDQFYIHMFDEFPETKALFSNDSELQKTKLLTTLDNVINGIEYIDELKEELFKLGQLHRSLNIKPEMFDHFLSTIVVTAKLSSNSSITDKELMAWENAFRLISDIMLDAYQ